MSTVGSRSMSLVPLLRASVGTRTISIGADRISSPSPVATVLRSPPTAVSCPCCSGPLRRGTSRLLGSAPVLPGDAQAAYRLVGGRQRLLGVGVAQLGEADEHAVDHRELRQTAGGRAGAERGLAGRGGEDVVADLADGRAGEVGDGHGGGFPAARLG